MKHWYHMCAIVGHDSGYELNLTYLMKHWDHICAIVGHDSGYELNLTYLMKHWDRICAIVGHDSGYELDLPYETLITYLCYCWARPWLWTWPTLWNIDTISVPLLVTILAMNLTYLMKHWYHICAIVGHDSGYELDIPYETLIPYLLSPWNQKHNHQQRWLESSACLSQE